MTDHDDHLETDVLEAELPDRVAAIDIAKASAMVCTRLPHDRRPARRVQQVWAVKATMPAITELADQLVCRGVQLVVMEATGNYWKPFFYVLEDRGLVVWLVNPRDVKNVPGRPKTDKLDAIWLAKLAERGMLRPSFVPTAPERELRDLTRMRRTLIQEQTRHRQRVHDILEDACIKIADSQEGLSDLFGVSGRAILDALAAGQRNPKTLAELARGAARNKIPTLAQQLTGRFTDHHGYQIQTLLALHDHLQATINELTARIEELITAIDPGGPDEQHPDRLPLIARLDEIPGVGPEVAQAIIGEIGVDMTRFPTGANLASWAKLVPRTIQSGAKNTHGKAGKGNGWLKGALGNAAVGTARTKTFLGARYRRIIKHAPKKVAVIAISRTILEIAWQLIADPDLRYTDLGPDWHDRHTNRDRVTRRHVRELQHLGYTVTLTPTTT